MLARLAAWIVGLACAAAAALLAGSERVPAPAPLSTWRAAHPDVRALAPDEQAQLTEQLDQARRDDLLALALALAAGCLAAGCARRGADRLARALLVAAGALGALSAGAVAWQSTRLLREGRMTFADDGLTAAAGRLAPALARWRAEIPEDHAVLIAGGHGTQLTAVAWVLRPRPLYLLPLVVPTGLDQDAKREAASSLPQGRDAPGRWLVDVAGLAVGRDDAVLRLDR